MIAINRGAEPEVLKGEITSDKYNHRSVVERLHRMQHGKCCYCENEISDKGHIKNVEHFRPKALFPELRNTWSNLLLACSQCNGRKSDNWAVLDGEDFRIVQQQTPEPPALLDPTETDPEAHLDYELQALEWDGAWCIIKARNNSARGRATIEITGLDDALFLRNRRKFYWEILVPQYENLIRAMNDPERFAVEKTRFKKLLADDHRMASFARAFARKKKLNHVLGDP